MMVALNFFSLVIFHRLSIYIYLILLNTKIEIILIKIPPLKKYKYLKLLPQNTMVGIKFNSLKRIEIQTLYNTI